MIDTVSIMSCERQPSFLLETIDSVPPQLNIEVFYQGDTSKLNLENCNLYKIKKYSESSNVFEDSQFNYACILLRSKNCLIVEDDIIFAKHFFEYLAKIQNDINTFKENVGERYAIALYSCYSWPNNTTVNLTSYPVDSFYGTQAMLYDEYTAREFGHFLMGRIGVEPYDLALKTYISTVDPSVKLIAATRSIVQHAGHTTSGLGFFHQTSNFIDD